MFVYRARWLTCPDPDAEELFRMVGEVFIFWSKSHVSPHFSAVLWYLLGLFSLLCHVTLFCVIFWQNFKREEQNFVVMNEINNMSFLTADSKSKMSKVRVDKQTSSLIKDSLSFIEMCNHLLHIWSCNTSRN